MAEPFDAIVIGSGMGGLATASLLARHARQRVLVLERHWTAGGFTQAFRRPGYDWDTGLHYVGEVQSPHSLLRQRFDELTDDRLEWAPMGDPYDRIVIAGDAYDLHAGPKGFVEGLSRHFPAERRVLEVYVALVLSAAATAPAFFAEKMSSGWPGARPRPWQSAGFLRHALRTTREVLDSLTPNARLKAVLTGQFGNYGLPPARASFGAHALQVRHYLWGGSYPVGGAGRIAAAIEPGIEAAGGRILVGAEVEQVLVERGRATGVRLVGGDEVRAGAVVSATGLHNTAGRLLAPDDAERGGLLAPARSLRRSNGHICLYLGFRGTAEELGFPRHNLWLYPGDDHDAQVAAAVRDPDAPPPFVYVSFPSARDPDFARRHPGRATAEVTGMALWDRYSCWEHRPWRRRGPDYDALKRREADRLLEQLWPHVSAAARRALDVVEISTPLSTRHHSNYGEGEIYGLEHAPARFAESRLRPRTGIPGLWLTGQDVTTCGIGAALFSGALTASAILGRNLVTGVLRAE